ncbi:MAG TPA: protein kinase [Chloroflexia bacterium]|nr:protein kinase [Chloroflexia bacterium]
MLHGRYRILRVLGGGGMGAVYLAEDTRTPGSQIAVKEMRTESEVAGTAPTAEAQEERRQAIDSFEREADILKHLSHPNMPTFSDSFEEGGRPYLVMEFVPGDSLEKKLEKLDGKPMGEREVLYYGIQTARILRYLHSQNPPIIFRDVKPANVMIMPNYQVKLIDFGIARKYKAGQRKDTVSMGTAAYAPFEQFGKGQTDGRSDIYSLAATLYHLLTGRPPTPATTPTGLRDLNPAISPETEKLIVRAMDRDMAKRPQSARELEQELRQCYGIPFREPEPLPAPGARQAAPVPVKPTASPAPAQAPVPTPAPPITFRPATPPVHPPVHVAPPAPGPAPGPVPNGPAAAPVAPATGTPVATPPAGLAPAPGPTVPCPHCGHSNKPAARFCGSCGATLGGRPPARLQVLGPRGVLWERRIASTENPFVIGRRSLSRNIFPHVDLTYSDPAAYVSRRHAQIVADAQGYSLEDLGSENGTFVNDVRLKANAPVLLRNGDLVQVGKVQMQFSIG